MLWLTIVTMEVICIAIILIYRRYTFFKIQTLDKVLYNFREMRFHAAMLLSDTSVAETGDKEEMRELLAFVILTTDTVNNFDELKSSLFKFKSFVIIFMKIHYSFDNIEKTNMERNLQTHELKKKFIDNLYLAFSTVPFFHFRVIALLIPSILKLLSKASAIKTLDKVKKLQHMFDLYALIKKKNTETPEIQSGYVPH